MVMLPKKERPLGDPKIFRYLLYPRPFFSPKVSVLWQKKYKDFEVVETGWPRQDWIFRICILSMKKNPGCYSNTNVKN